MNKKILFSATPTEKRAALLEDGKVVELVVERPDSLRLVGNIYRGKVTTVAPGIQAAFIDIGLDKAAFLHISDVDPMLLLDQNSDLFEQYNSASRKRKRFVAKIPIEKILQKDQEILVQVLKEPIGTKGPKVTTQISVAGRFLVLVPDADFIGVSKKNQDAAKRKRLKQLIMKLKPPGIGFIVRTIGLKVSEVEFEKEIRALLEEWHSIQQKALDGSGPQLLYREVGITTRVIRDMFSDDVEEVWVDQEEDFKEIQNYLAIFSPDLCNRVKLFTESTPLFERFDIERDLERSLKRKVWLKSGGCIIFDHTEALLAIDVNTGRATGKNSEQTIFNTNIEAAREIARQLRLRDIGGIIVIDFIDMPSSSLRRKLEEEMRRILSKDPTTTSCTGLSKFSLMEITRKRVRPELQELYTDVCLACNGLGWVLSPATITTRIDRRLKTTDFRNSGKTVTLLVNPSVAAYLLNSANQILNKLQQEHGITLKVEAEENLDHDEYEFRV